MRHFFVKSLFFIAIAAICPVFSGCSPKTIPIDSKLAKTMTDVEAQKSENSKAGMYYMIIEGEDAILRGDIERARSAFNAVVRVDPKNAQAHQMLARIAIHDGDFKAALQHAREAHDLDPANTQNSIVLAGLYAATGELDEAIRVYTEIIKRTPDNEEIPLLLSGLLMMKRDYKGSESVLKAYTKRWPDNALGYFELARLWLVQDSCDKARPYLQKALEVDPRFSRAELAMGLCSEAKGNEKEAIEHYERALQLDPDNTAVRARLVRMHLRQNNLDEAEKQNERLNLMQFNEMDIRVNRGMILYHEGRFAEAVTEFNLVVASDPKNGQALYFLGLCQTRLNNLDDALKTYARMPQDNELYPDALSARGVLLRRLGKLTEAEALLKNALQIRPDDPYLLRTMALVVADKGDTEGAIRILKKAASLAPHESDMIYTMANVLERAGRWQEGVALMEDVLKKDPKNADALNYVGYTLVDHDMDLERAAGLLKKAMELRPTDGYIVDSYGWALYKYGQFEEALKQLQKAHEMVPDEPEITEHVGDCHLRMNNKPKAIEFFKRALELHPEKKQYERLMKKVSELGV
jgi:tetratricopeptide (TPR) repeat protein